MPVKKHTTIALALLPLFFFIASCHAPKKEAVAKKKEAYSHIDFLIYPQAKSMIPFQGENYSEQQITNLLFNNLVRANYMGSISPELAESWEVGPDQRSYTFHLRKNVYFHNGKKLTAADVIFTLEKLIQNAYGKYAEINFIEGFEDFLRQRSPRVRGIVKVDDFTFTIRLSKQFKFFLQFLAAEYMAILPKAYAGMPEATFSQKPVGTGPFKLTATSTKMVDRQNFLVFKLLKNENYFEPTSHLDEINIFSANTEIATTTKEYFDLFSISNSEIPHITRRPNLKIINSTFDIVNFLILNTGENKQMKNPKIRQLIYAAINREALVETIFNRHALPAHSMIPFGLLGNNPYSRIDYALAKKISSELAPGKINFTILTITKDERQAVAEFVARELAKFNIEVKIITIADQYEYFNRIIYDTQASVIMGGVPDYPSSYHFLTHLVERGGYYNVFKYAFPVLQAKIKELPSVDIINETRILAEINSALADEAIYIPLYHYSGLIAIKNRIKHISFNYGEMIDFSHVEVVDESVH